MKFIVDNADQQKYMATYPFLLNTTGIQMNLAKCIPEAKSGRRLMHSIFIVHLFGNDIKRGH